MAKRTVITEQTSKTWKAVQLLGAVVFAAGLFLAFAAPAAGVPLAFLGLVAFLAGRFGAWWCHG